MRKSNDCGSGSRPYSGAFGDSVRKKRGRVKMEEETTIRRGMTSPYGFAGAAAFDDDDEEEGGFRMDESKNLAFEERMVMVSTGKNGSAPPTSVVFNPRSSTTDKKCLHFFPCRNESQNWRRKILFVILAILLACFLLISGLFFYFDGISYKIGRNIIKESCLGKTCPYYGICLEEETRVVCRCPEEICPEVEEPICGTNGQTFKNLCVLRSTSCREKQNIRVQYPGNCNIPDPCEGHACPYGAKCVVQADRPICQCPKACPNYGEHRESKPICGSDARDYNDLCSLRKSACERAINLTVKYFGKCDPCEGLECEEWESCQLDFQRNPTCRCSESCPGDFSPVCGSNGRTYTNECELRQYSCKKNADLRVLFEGTCNEGANPCSSSKCKPYQECVVNKFGVSSCECISNCDPIARPVCGNDGVTYDSFCHLMQSSCRRGQGNVTVTVAYSGICDENDECRGRDCEFGAECVWKGNGKVACECPKCTNEYEPVCGSDGISYGNACHLRREACQRKRHNQPLYPGLCSGCLNKKCAFHARCESSGSEGKCVCPANCPEEKKPLCGSDGQTYDNECELKTSSCRKQENISVSHRGKCVTFEDDCRGVKCRFGARCEKGICVCPSDCSMDLSVDITEEPVCASDMKTYANECEMQKHSCLNSLSALVVLFYGSCEDKIDTSVLHQPKVFESLTISPPAPTHSIYSPNIEDVCRDIKCDFEATCERGENGLAHCSCIFNCSSADSKNVCGSDLQMHPSMCHMKLKACQMQEEIRLRPMDLCQGMEVKPCNGRIPVSDPETGQEYDCGSGPNRRDCPSDSYCHQTHHFARCCAKETGIGMYITNCRDSWYGCCPDNKTSALGPDNAGCPSICNCNKLGSFTDGCDPETGQCKCKPGVGGIKCDRCEPGFWGLPKISSGHPGCLPCGCSRFGSVRDDCEQMTGRCVCKPDVQGAKCTYCTDKGQLLGPNGCSSADATTLAPTSCEELSCYFGAECQVQDELAKCICHVTCTEDYNSQPQAVCGNDGQTYNSECQLKLYSCRYQKDIAVQALSSCTNYIGTVAENLSGLTDSSKINTPQAQNILYHPANTAESAAKVKDIYHVITEPGPLIGDSCGADRDCPIENSFCNAASICVCKESFSETADKQSCFEGQTLAVTHRACLSAPCQNEGLCADKTNGEFECICSFPFYGVLCEDTLINREIEVPSFGGQSYIQVKALKAYHKFSVEIQFKTYTSNGILLYSQQRSDGTGDFISLAIVNGYAEFRYNLGNGPAILTSLQYLAPNKYHKVVAKRYQRDGILQVNGNETITGQSEGTLKALDLSNGAYIGYVPLSMTHKLLENVGTSAGFIGCVKALKIGRHEVTLRENPDTIVEKVREVNECATMANCESNTDSCGCFGLCEIENNPCFSNPCQSASSCEPLLQGGYFCNCAPGYAGDHCETFDPDAEDVYIAAFNGADSYVKFPCLDNAKRGFSIEIWFFPQSSNGVLLYNGQSNRRGDFIAINLVNGYIQFRFNLGSGMANISTENKVDVGRWNVVKVNRFDRLGTIRLNNGTVVRGMSGPALAELNLESPLYIGGYATLSDVSRESGILDKFSGAIQRLTMNGKQLRLKMGEKIDVTPYTNHPCFFSTNICANDGLCLPYLSAFVCKCLALYTGNNCETSLAFESNASVSFDGNTYLQFRQVSARYRTLNDTVVEDYNDNHEEYSYYDTDEDTFDSGAQDEFFKGKMGKRFAEYEFSIRTRQNNGMILWTSRIRQSFRDYIAVVITDGFVEFVRSFGKEKQIITLKSHERISDGLWHSVWILHRKRQTLMRIDYKKTAKVTTENILKLFPIDGKMFIGGVPTLPTDLPPRYYSSYKGCFKNFILDRNKITTAQLTQDVSKRIELCRDEEI